jgi:hypothetical protein
MEALQRASHRNFVSERDSALDYAVDDGVHYRIRQANAGAKVVILDKPDPFFSPIAFHSSGSGSTGGS